MVGLGACLYRLNPGPAFAGEVGADNENDPSDLDLLEILCMLQMACAATSHELKMGTPCLIATSFKYRRNLRRSSISP